jgi:hypothetical protein
MYYEFLVFIGLYTKQTFEDSELIITGEHPEDVENVGTGKMINMYYPKSKKPF